MPGTAIDTKHQIRISHPYYTTHYWSEIFILTTLTFDGFFDFHEFLIVSVARADGIEPPYIGSKPIALPLCYAPSKIDSVGRGVEPLRLSLAGFQDQFRRQLSD